MPTTTPPDPTTTTKTATTTTAPTTSFYSGYVQQRDDADDEDDDDDDDNDNDDDDNTIDVLCFCRQRLYDDLCASTKLWQKITNNPVQVPTFQRKGKGRRATAPKEEDSEIEEEDAVLFDDERGCDPRDQGAYACLHGW